MQDQPRGNPHLSWIKDPAPVVEELQNWLRT